MTFQINKKYYIYIGIMIGFLIASIDTSVIAEENDEDKAIELAKQAVIEVVEEGEDLTVQEFIEYRSKRREGNFLPIGWEAIDVSASTYAVTFTYRYKEQTLQFLFHVLPQDNIAQRIHTRRNGLNIYIRNIKAVSTYSDKKVEDNFVKLFSRSLEKETSSLHAQQTTTVIRVVDGDTLKVRYWGKEESIRLIGIDTPGSRVNNKTKKDAKRSGQDIKTTTAMGKKATEYVESLVKQGDLITIEFDVEQRDRYGRLLCYIYLPNGKMLNEEIVKAGYANVMTVPPNVKYKDRFLKAYKEARESKRGLWEEF